MADTPAGTKYPLDIDRNPDNFSLADDLELRDQLARLLTIVRRYEKDGRLATASSRELLDRAVLGVSGWRKPFYGDLIYCLWIFLPTNSYRRPQFDDLTEVIHHVGSEVIEGAIARNEDRIAKKIALLSPQEKNA